MNDKSRGLYDKFRVERVDGSSEAGNRHHGCDYFVLDLTHDPHALPALAAYSVSCADEYPRLAEDLKMKCGHELTKWELREIEREALIQTQATQIAELRAAIKELHEETMAIAATGQADFKRANEAEAELEVFRQSGPEGCTPADAEMLREANHNLAIELTSTQNAHAALEAELDRVKKDWVPLYSGGKGNP